MTGTSQKHRSPTNDCTVFMWRINTVARKGSKMRSGRNAGALKHCFQKAMLCRHLDEFRKTCQELLYYDDDYYY